MQHLCASILRRFCRPPIRCLRVELWGGLRKCRSSWLAIGTAQARLCQIISSQIFSWYNKSGCPNCKLCCNDEKPSLRRRRVKSRIREVDKRSQPITCLVSFEVRVSHFGRFPNLKSNSVHSACSTSYQRGTKPCICIFISHNALTCGFVHRPITALPSALDQYHEYLKPPVGLDLH
jgi:hypothetical protein